MADMPEVAKATVTIIPNMQGAQATITKELAGASTPAGTAAGKVAGGALAASMGASMTKAGKGLTKGVTVPIMAIGAAAVASWKSVDAGLDEITKKTGATGDALDDLGDIMKNIAKTVPTDFTTAGKAVGEVNTRFGVTGDELEALSKQFVKFADITGEDVSSSIDNVQKAMAAFNVDTKDASAFLDTLNVVGQQTGVDMGTLANDIVSNSAVLKELGMSAADAAFFIGNLDKSGVDSSTALAALKRAMVNASDEGKTTSEAIADLQAKLDNTSSSVEGVNAVAELFGTRAAPAMYDALKNGTITFDELGASLDSFSGSVSSTFEETKSPLESFETTMNNLKITGAELAEAAMPLITSIAETVLPIVQSIADAWQSLSPEMQDAIVKMALIAAAAGPITTAGGKITSTFSGIGNAVSGVSGKLSSGASSLSSFGSSASTAATGASTAGTSFTTFAGQALLLVAAGAAIFLVAEAMNILANAAIQLVEAGPEAIGVFVLLAAVGVGVTAAIVAIGSAATVSAVGLLAMGAAVLMVAAGIALIIVSMAVFVAQLPTLAEYGGPAALAMLEIAGGMVAITVAAVLLAASVALVAVGFLALTVASIGAVGSFVALMAELVILDAEFVIMAAALVLIESSMTKIAQSAASAADDMKLMVSAVDVVDAGLNGLKATAENAWNAFLGIFSSGEEKMSNALDGNMKKIVASTQQQTMIIGVAWDTIFKTMLKSTNEAMKGIQKRIVVSLNSIQEAFAATKLSFNQSISIPHFKMTGNFNAETGTVPTVGVTWYGSAAEKGALFSVPQVVGVGDASQPELLLGENTLYENIADAVREGGGQNQTINFVLPNGQTVASYYFNDLVRYSKSNGTPIVKNM